MSDGVPDGLAALRLRQAVDQQTALETSEVFRHRTAHLAHFGDTLLDDGIALTRIIRRLLHLLDEIGDLDMAHLLRHSSCGLPQD